ncbi:two-component system, NarL family, sensor histidine kinase DesK [Luteibacter sp. UNC138MFCol5.1]|uniref:sensor histidine kinase n=1 Tax=Luteibacter sp. UNC138MFCol5.1 TaxID=1502774 RepID=UPI0008AF9585|nr:sensor histidine kinase [Luteibacter sp. UNC138MFCol5.1]SEO83115.1 two-component system, NarL family, sensor histidine kinase DesK [Luteibacter sp. UNC138MFCol5.1]
MIRVPPPHRDSLLGGLRSPVYLRWQGGLQVFWLVALIQAPLAVKGFDWDWMAPTLISIPVYLVCYVSVYVAPLSRLPFNAAMITLLGFTLWPVNPVSVGYVVIGVTLLAYARRARVWLLGTLVATVVTQVWVMLFHVPQVHVFVVFGVSLAAGFSNFLYVRGARRDAELRLSQAEVRRLATLAERERIGRDLHDLLGHTLSLITLKSELARRLALADPARAQQEMEEVERVARHTLAEVRSAVTGLRAGDLASELVSARLMLEASGIALHTELPDGFDLPQATEATLSLVLREAVTNIHRHSRATEAHVVISRKGQDFAMRITDNGCGGLAAHGNGVSGMRERMRQIGGRLAIDSPPKQGTVLSIDVPCHADRMERIA